MNYLLELQHLRAGYGRKIVLRDVNLQLQGGKCYGILGPNGSGKSTLLAVLSGIHKYKKGIILWNGQPVSKLNFKNNIGYVPQENPLIPELSVKDNLSLWYQNKDQLEQERKEGFLAEFQLDKEWDTPVRKLSEGMKKRVSLGCAMANKPEILLLDEPGASVDLLCKQRMQEYLQDFKKHGGAIVISTHDESEIKLCDTLFYIEDGKIKEVKTDEKGLNSETIICIFRSSADRNS